LNPYHIKIIEYAFVKEDGTFKSSLINPGEQLDKKIVDITKITNEMLKDAPKLKEKTEEIWDYIYNTSQKVGDKIYMIAHNADGYDRFLLKRIFANEPLKLEYIKKNIVYIDTLHLAKLVLPTMRSFSMATLCKIFQIDSGNHRAYGDTMALQKVYKTLIKKLAHKYSQNVNYFMENPEIVYDLLY
jgi:DNA polymerase III alpha subunit (gram-positive type)